MLFLQKTGFLLDITDWISILENLSQRLYKHQRVMDMQHLKDLLEENEKNCFNTRVMHASISLDIVYLKLSK